MNCFDYEGYGYQGGDMMLWRNCQSSLWEP